jgi:hypothetical protein
MAELIDNTLLRSAVAAFAASPAEQTYFDVLRSSMQGDLLLDATGSAITFADDGSAIAKGSTISFRDGTAPDGGRAMFAFTNQAQVGNHHPDDRESVQTIGQSAISVLEFAVSQGYSWLYIDPAGPTCALEVAHVQFVLRNHHNDAVKTALVRSAGAREAALDALALGGSLLYAVSENADGSVEIATSTSPTGGPVYLAFTSAAEALARDAGAAVANVDLPRVVSDALTEPFTGLVINPAGPWIALDHEDLRTLQLRLPAVEPEPIGSEQPPA